MSDQPWDGPAVILVALDGSDTSLRAAAYAAGLARRQHSRLVCLYVQPSSAAAGVGAGAAITMQEAYDEVAADLRQTFEAQIPRLGIDAELMVRDGSLAPRSSGWPRKCGLTR